MAHRLNKLLKKAIPHIFQLDDEQTDYFNALIKTFCSSPVLDVQEAVVLYSINCDVRNYGIGWALFQIHPDGERNPIGS